jgi:hypothetical protein
MTFLSPIASDSFKVIDYIEGYEKAITEIEPFFTLEGRKLVEICQNLPKEMYRFKKMSSELKSMYELIELRRDEHEGKKHKALNEGNHRTLTSKDIQQYIKGDKEFVDLSELMLEINFLRQKTAAILEAMDIMHWQMSNVTKLHVASIEQTVL